MADQVEPTGRLIAIDGTRAKDLGAAAEAVAAALRDRRVECAISRFDASGLFGELAAAGGDRNISARTLALVYAADLAFRLRWEIRPVLEAGGIVIAIPYVDSAAAIGVSHGLNEEWIRDLLRFAPAPHLRSRSEEKKIARGWKATLKRGYGEYCAAMLSGKANSKSKSARAQAVALLHRPRGRKVHRLDDAGVAGLVTALTGSRPGGRSRSASPPRSARR